MKTPWSGLRNTSTKLSLQFAMLYSVLVVLMFFVAYRLSIYEIRDRTFDQMRADAETLTGVYVDHGTDRLIEHVKALQTVNFENSRIFLLIDETGRTVSGNILEMDLAAVTGDDVQFIPVDDIEIDGLHEDEVNGYWLTQNRIGPFQFVQGTGDHVGTEVVEALGISLAIGAVLAIAAGLLAGVWVGKITEKRIVDISNTLDRVSTGDLQARIPISVGASDDLSRVSENVNATLGRLETLLETQQQISNDIAHDLRTPLQRLRQRLERLQGQSQPAPTEAGAALAEVEDIITTFNALLRIAQVEAGDLRARFEMVDLDNIAETVFEVFEPSAENQNQTLHLTHAPSTANVLGDRALLLQLVSNLIENALRHCPVGTAINVSVDTSDARASLTVSDNGPGIPAEDHDRVFRRFFRGDKSRSSTGHGLGLATVKAIATLHEAEVSLSDNDPGLRVTIEFRRVKAT
ncbi:HAMP domain-containing histidine kinase [Ruegeria sp. R13_0]|uniref:sensor histidine kinase n=1 Tax=Ruegeria sp. R13_0 TaxID=2821099 RepID=UPI001AD9B738|nr:HAMP domain-containing sensor histidine kinase [Ruegeria sp. R13_0]MBO9433418.1 HAMP domain-containing histidine kinase [Ruegeria sp. R13_0]